MTILVLAVLLSTGAASGKQVPETSTMALVGLGLVAVGLLRRIGRK